MSAEDLNRIGLVLNLFSGLLLVPEVLDRLPIDRMQQWIEKALGSLGTGLRFPLRLQPPSWKLRFSEDQRENIEIITAISSLVLSVIWISTLVAGAVFHSKFFILLGLTIFGAVILRNIVGQMARAPQLSRNKIIGLFLLSIPLLAIGMPFASIIRVLLIILRAVVRRVTAAFSRHAALRGLLLGMAVLFFVISNVLQFVATYIK